MLEKSAMSLDKINEECYRYISKLTQEISCLEIKLNENESMEWRMLLSNEIMDRRQKIFDDIEIISDSSVDSYRYGKILEIDDC